MEYTLRLWTKTLAKIKFLIEKVAGVYPPGWTTSSTILHRGQKSILWFFSRFSLEQLYWLEWDYWISNFL